MKALAIVLLFAVSFTSDWTLEIEEEGVRVFTKAVEGEPIKATRAVAEFDAAPELILGILSDPSQSMKWMDRVSLSKMVRKINENSFIVYNQISLPWPMDDRDLVVKVNVKREGEKIIMSMKNAPSEYPQQAGMIRMPKYIGTWILEPLPDGRTLATSESFSTIGGSIPDWLLGGAVESAKETMVNLRAYLG